MKEELQVSSVYQSVIYCLAEMGRSWYLVEGLRDSAPGEGIKSRRSVRWADGVLAVLAARGRHD